MLDDRVKVKGFMSYKDDPKHKATLSSKDEIEILSSEVQMLMMILGMFMAIAEPSASTTLANSLKDIEEGASKEPEETKNQLKYKAEMKLLTTVIGYLQAVGSSRGKE